MMIRVSLPLTKDRTELEDFLNLIKVMNKHFSDLSAIIKKGFKNNEMINSEITELLRDGLVKFIFNSEDEIYFFQ
jgi:hypothetical protein